jgi:hypothetical protein
MLLLRHAPILPPFTLRGSQTFRINVCATRDRGVKSGFLSGAGDCLFWVAHAKWLSRNVDDLERQIDHYYKTNPSDRGMPVTTVWKNVLLAAPPAKPRPPGGETWTNRHGYYDGTWWVQSPESERRAFLEGYLWCLQSCVSKPSEIYSKPVSYYEKSISGYIQLHPESAYDEAIADMLSRYRDDQDHKGHANKP